MDRRALKTDMDASFKMQVTQGGFSWACRGCLWLTLAKRIFSKQVRQVWSVASDAENWRSPSRAQHVRVSVCVPACMRARVCECRTAQQMLQWCAWRCAGAAFAGTCVRMCCCCCSLSVEREGEQTPGLATMSKLCFNKQCAASTCTVRFMPCEQSEPTWIAFLKGPRFHLPRQRFWLKAYVESQPRRCPGWAWGGGLDPPDTKPVSQRFTHCTPGS